MKKFLALCSTLLFVPQAQLLAAEAESSYDFTTGVLELPELEMDGAVFYVRLNLQDPDALTFQVDLDSVVNLTPLLDADASDETAIFGSWNAEGVDVRYSFETDGSFSMFQGEGVDPDLCPEGGAESGGFSWTPRTGVLLTDLAADQNGDCGTSNPALLRMFIDGNTMEVYSGDELVYTMIR